MHSKKKIKKPQSTEVERAQEGFVGALLETRNKKNKASCQLYLKQKRLGFWSSLFGPVELPFTLPVKNQTPILSVTGAKCTEDSVQLPNTHWLCPERPHRHLTSVQKRRTGGSPEYFPPVPKCCICELKTQS